MNYRIQNEQSGMEWAVNQEGYHRFDTPADPEGQALYEALIEELGIELPPSNPEQGMVANATDGVNNDQASFYSQALPQANYDDISRRLSREEMDAYTRDILGPNNLLGFEGDMRVNNDQAPVHSHHSPQLPRYNSPFNPYGNYDSIVTNTPSQPPYVNPAELQNNGGNSCQRVVTQQMANHGTGFSGTGGFHPRTIAQVPKPSEYMDVDSVPADNIDPALLEDTPPGPIHIMSGHMDIDVPVAGQLSSPGRAPISANGNGNNEGNDNDEDNDNNEGSSNNNFEGYNNNEDHNYGDTDALMMDHEGQAPVAQAPTFAGAGHPSPAPPQPLIVPKTLKRKTAGNRVKRQAATKRKVGKKACSGCRKSKLRCELAQGGTTCLECLERSRPCDIGRTTDDRTRETNRDKLLRTIEGCKRYLGDLLILIYSIKTAMDQGKLNDKMSMIRSELSNGLTRVSMLVYILTNQQLTPEDEQNAQACVRLDALAGLQSDLQGIENNLADMRKTVRKCVGKTKDCVKTLGRYLHVLMDDEDHVGDAEISLRTIKESRTPFRQIDTDMKVQFSYIADNSDLVTSLVGHVDRLKAA
ncbi:hypothetical protein K4K59_011983 [Colletotrichum sp. SAR11_240]|nr:hypothetical protein K4K59_011983 [Colletotrichum sp. SAR11_240]